MNWSNRNPIVKDIWYAVINGSLEPKTKVEADNEDWAREQILIKLANGHDFDAIKMWASGNYEVTQ